MESADHYIDSNGLIAKWTSTDFASITANGRNGNGILFTNSGFVSKTLDHQSTWIYSWAWYTTITFGGGGGPANVWACAHVGTNLVYLQIEQDGTFSFVTPFGIVISNSTPFSIHNNTWYNLQVKCTISGGGGQSGNDAQTTVALKVNGALVAGGIGDTGFQTTQLRLQTNTANHHIFFGQPGTIIDDLAIADNEGAPPHVVDYMGDVQIGALTVRSDNAVSWNIQPGSPTTHFDKVDQITGTKALDSSYIFSQTHGQQDIFNWQPTSQTIIVGVHCGAYVRKDAEGTRSFQLIVTSGAGAQQSPIFYPGDTYTYFFYAMDTDSSAVWTQSSFDAITGGIQEVT